MMLVGCLLDFNTTGIVHVYLELLKHKKNVNEKCHFLHVSITVHYENMPMLYTVIFYECKNVNFQMKICDFFFLSLLKT